MGDGRLGSGGGCKLLEMVMAIMLIADNRSSCPCCSHGQMRLLYHGKGGVLK